MAYDVSHLLTVGHAKDIYDNIGGKLATKAEIDGSYEQLTAGNAEQLVATIGISDKVPYNFRTSGGSVDIGDREVDKIIGGTIAWNQLIRDGNFPNSTSLWTTGASNASVAFSGNEATLTLGGDAWNNDIRQKTTFVQLTQGHKVVFSLDYLMSSGLSACSLRIGRGNGSISGLSYSSSYQHFSTVFSVTSDFADNTKTLRITLWENGSSLSGQTIKVKNFCCFDLTAMFGSTIADYIYSLETGTAGAGVAWFRHLFPMPYYAYSAGSLQSVNTSKHRMVGFNAYDNSTGTAKLVGGMQYQITGTYTAISLDGTSITPDASGKFTPGANGTLTVTGGNATDTCVHLVWDGSRNGEYEAYTVREYALDSDLTLRGIPKLDADNRLYYDGDSYESDGTVTRKYGSRAYTSGDATDGSTMITDGTTTVYKLTTPTTESADAYTNPQIVDDFGTEEYIDAGVTASTPTRDVAVPVGHDTMYRANLRAKLEMAPNSPDGDGDYIVRQSGGENVYVPISIPADELPDAPTTDGTYVLTCTVADGSATFTWESTT